jgi:hypothetical protein
MMPAVNTMREGTRLPLYSSDPVFIGSARAQLPLYSSDPLFIGSARARLRLHSSDPLFIGSAPWAQQMSRSR